MKLDSIRENYSRLLAAFNKAGVKLTESQKADIDTFIVGLEAKIQKVKESTAKVTKKIVTEHLEKQYKEVFESITAHQAKNAELAAKIQDKITKLNESKKIARKVDNYLNLYVESVLPKKTIVDYNRMQKLENVFESLKDTLLVNDESVQAKKAELTESYAKEKRDLETKVAKLQVKLNESMANELKLNKKIDVAKAKVLLESKVKDLPVAEAKQMKKRFEGATTAEVESKFKKVLESVKKEIKEASKEEETTLESEIAGILEADEKKGVKEDDILKGRNHNGHLNEDDEEVDEAEDDEKVDEAEDDDIKESDEKVDEADEELDEDDVELDESEKINKFQMAMWCDRVEKIETHGY